MEGRHALKSYLDRTNTDQVVFAHKSGCSESHLSLFLKGRRGLSALMAKRISDATEGDIPITVLAPEKVAEAHVIAEAAQ